MDVVKGIHRMSLSRETHHGQTRAVVSWLSLQTEGTHAWL
ncbi:hypothetical protein [Pseudomonas phage vB_PaeM_PS119XW]|uniref:Uncharacterized protein n=1 Tax=Pseudomonas phage vB_PaeM_PS119XW TaxID=2601632 RepID=A0A5C1K846_9CAUD|nr:hypothetical protein PP933_gp353 [Pseudomonas phage vB_PaeM_PS119XW]QEM42082.1 hypothetical protein [Pseudomonas phage vB_PaeM_PS119XW]